MTPVSNGMPVSNVDASPLVTVLMPVCDGERFLREAIESILCQTFSDFEFLIIDDASTDSSRAIINGYDDPRIRLLVNDCNIGVTRTLNRGIQEARGRYLARMDADDISVPERLEQQLKRFEAHPECAVVTSFASIIDDDSTTIGHMISDFSPPELDRMLQLRNRLVHGAVMMRCDIVRRLGAYDESMRRSQDYDLWLRISDEYPIHTVPELLYAWRQHGDGITSLHRDEQVRYATRARDAALVRRMNRVIARLREGQLSVQEGTRIVLRRMRDEDEFRVSKLGRRDLLTRLRRRIRLLDDVCYLLTERSRRRSVREIVHSHSRDDAPASRLVELIASGSPS